MRIIKNNRFWIFGVLALMLVSLVLHLYKQDQVPPCLNADEAAFGYNAYSILKTGRDEYGVFLPLRLKSFGDYKMPLYSYSLIPFIALFGLDEFTVRLPNIIFGVLLVPSIYYLAYEIFQKKNISLLSSFILVFSLWPYILSRHAHEAVLCTLLLVISFGTYFHAKNKNNNRYFIISLLSLFLAQFAYHPARIFGLFYLFLFILDFILLRFRLNKLNKLVFIFICLIVISPFLVDRFYSPERVSNLFFMNDPGFKSRIHQDIYEDKNRIIHNKVTESIKTVTNNYLRQISYEFLLIDGDKDTRFGMKGMSPLNVISFIFFVWGLYVVIKKKNKDALSLLLLLFLVPLINALTWREPSISRTYLFIIPFSIFSGFGIHSLLKDIKNHIFYIPILLFMMFTFTAYFIFAFDIYFNHYPEKTQTSISWQCGYKELVNLVKEEYSNFNNVYITRSHGQPYIFFLFYLLYDPHIYQGQSNLSESDEYGFGQVDKFDKFNFQLNTDNLQEQKTMWIGYPDQLNKVDQNKIQKLMCNDQHIFSVFRNY